MLCEQIHGVVSDLPAEEDAVAGQKQPESMVSEGSDAVLINDSSEVTLRTYGKSGKRFSKHTTDILAAWFDNHASKPFPTKEERLQLLEETGLRSSKIHLTT
jgi:hypothetical protein